MASNPVLFSQTTPFINGKEEKETKMLEPNAMATLRQILREERHPEFLMDALIMSAVVYSNDPREELENIRNAFGLPVTADYEFVDEESLRECKQVVLMVRSIARNHLVVACRGTMGFMDALTDINVMHKALPGGIGSAHAGFLDRAQSIPTASLRRLLIRGYRLVLTGHSLGGAVASLLALKLLKESPKWCHEQIHVYTFGCPFFSDVALARHINGRYRSQFVHVVSKSDIVPKVMPVAHVLYTLWAGVEAMQPMQELFDVVRVGVLLTNLFSKKTSKPVRRLTLAAQAASWMPRIAGSVLHRLVALVLTRRSGNSYAFAGRMVLLDPKRSDNDGRSDDKELFYEVEKLLGLQREHMSMEGVKKHSLLSYIDHVFAVNKEVEAASEPKVHDVAVSFPGLPKKKTRNAREWMLKTNKEKGKKAFKSRVAGLVFAKRMKECSLPPSSSGIVKSEKEDDKKGSVFSVVWRGVRHVVRAASRLRPIMWAPTIYWAVVEIRSLFLL